MERFGKSLEKVLFERKFRMSRLNVYHFGQMVLTILESVHQAGIVYNDLKFDNLLLNYNQDIPKECRSTQNCFANV